MTIEKIVAIAVVVGVTLVIMLAALLNMLRKAKKLSNAELVPLLIARNRELKVICFFIYTLDIVAVICAVGGILVGDDILRNIAVGLFIIFTFIATMIVLSVKSNYKIVNRSYASTDKEELK